MVFPLRKTCLLGLLVFISISASEEPNGYCSRFQCEYKIIQQLTKLETAQDELTKTINDIQAISLAKSQKIDELTKQIEELKARTSAVAFKVRLSKDVTINVGQRVLYDHVVANIGNSFIASSGTFRAPSNGTFMFSVTACSKGDDWGVLDIICDGITIGQVRSGNNGGYYDCNSEVTVAYLEEGSSVWIERSEGGTGVQNAFHWNSFTAVLIN